MGTNVYNSMAELFFVCTMYIRNLRAKFQVTTMYETLGSCPIGVNCFANK